MKRTAVALTLVLALLFSAVGGTMSVFVNVSMANFSPNTVFMTDIVIKKDGSVTPETGFVNRTGNVYTLTRDISNYSLVIQRSNITLDGKGHIIDEGQPNPNVSVYGEGLTLEHVTNVTVKDLELTRYNEWWAFTLENCSECNVVRVKTPQVYLRNGCFNTIARSIIGRLTLSVSHNNLVIENNVTSIMVQFCDSNNYYKNNFLSAGNSFQYYYSNKESFWDNGSIGNYWFDYLTRFPNASEIGNSGIGNTPYVINQSNKAWKYGEFVDIGILSKVTDHYPLMVPVDYFAPSIRVLSITNEPYGASTIPLNFSINEPASQIVYSLDGEENITIIGNITLTGLANGVHDITIYAWDEVGNVGVSETTYFSVNVPFPTTLFITASGASIAVVAAGLLVYFKKRKR